MSEHSDTITKLNGSVDKMTKMMKEKDDQITLLLDSEKSLEKKGQLNHSIIDGPHSFTHSFTHSFSHLFTHSLTNSLTHPLIVVEMNKVISSEMSKKKMIIDKMTSEMTSLRSDLTRTKTSEKKLMNDLKQSKNIYNDLRDKKKKNDEANSEEMRRINDALNKTKMDLGKARKMLQDTSAKLKGFFYYFFTTLSITHPFTHSLYQLLTHHPS